MLQMSPCNYHCSQLAAYQIQLPLSFKERRYQCPNCIRISQQVLEELELSRDTIEINDNTNEKVNNTEKKKVNTKNENKHSHKHKIRDANDNNDNNKQPNKLNVNGTIEERLMKLESKFNISIGTSEIKKEALQKPSYANIACLLYTSPSPRDKRQSRMPSSA